MAKNMESIPPQEDRRGFFSKAAAVVIGGLVGVIPFGAGLATLLDPIFRKGDKGEFRKIAALDAIPDDGFPRRYPVIATQRDAWNVYPNQPIGAIYLRRLPGESTVEAINAVCPHAGCFVDFNREAGDGGLFQCPCHRSDFKPDGERLEPETCPSPRNLDTLEVDQKKLAKGEVWVDFKNFKAGHPEKEPIQ
ncbi:Rieske 2Fe-2S domain-containing protein [Bremerella sp. JC817]|uniref:QcrA and Rieske domain-containing protein n=1 Tax=Bremerella sp. JC817 TaxID=3231756 RepID=UPI00345B2A13